MATKIQNHKMMYRILALIFSLLPLVVFGNLQSPELQSFPQDSVLKGKIICIDAGHGGTAKTDHYRVGKAGEREEWINLRVALALEKMLQARGAIVLMSRRTDENVSFESRIKLAVNQKADVFISIHHNSTADSTLNYPIAFYHGNASENTASIKLGKIFLQQIANQLYEESPPKVLVSDHLVYPGSGTAVLRGTYGIPGIIGEASFFSNRREEQKLKTKEYNLLEASAYVRTLELFFSEEIPPIQKVYSSGKIESLKAFQLKRKITVNPMLWMSNYSRAQELLKDDLRSSQEEAFNLLLQSIISFPNSPIAHKCLEQLVKLSPSIEPQFTEQLKKQLAEYYSIID
jgi:N-acetylmuramoyl-L-alanine amidase